jgi:hypothetical protein
MGLFAEVLTHSCIVQRLRIMPARHSMRFHYQGHFRREKEAKRPVYSRFAAVEFRSWNACQAGQFDLEGKI